jgi:hypothetical protein
MAIEEHLDVLRQGGEAPAILGCFVASFWRSSDYPSIAMELIW